MMTMMKKTYLALIGTLLLLTLGACRQSSAPEQKSDYRVRNEAFVEEKAKDPEYKPLSFDLSDLKIYYKVLEASTDQDDAERPLQNSKVEYAYSLSLISGEKVEVDQVMEATILDRENTSATPLIRGMQLALQHMTVGEEWEVVIPWQLGYGSYSMSSIPAYSTLIFEVKLLKISEL